MNMKNIMLKYIILILYLINVKAKIFERCELAKILYKHKFTHNDISKLVCIAYHQSGLDSSAYKQIYGNGGSHGLFQISDKYWCNSGLCNIPCHKLRDNDINDDVNCLKIILNEHYRISGDKFNAWGDAYKYYCYANTDNYIQDCYPKTNTIFATKRNNLVHKTQVKTYKPYYKKPQAKIYERCELAKELYYQHKMPLNQLEDWVCIAMHESNFNTSALGRLNTDSSIDHGIFQISDLYWCKSSTGNGYGCGITCDRLLDANLSDDVRCVKLIYDEHQRISGNGFTAWTVYNLHCKNKIYDYLSGCFNKYTQYQTNTNSITNTEYRTKTNTQYSTNTQYNTQTQTRHKTNTRTNTNTNVQAKTTRRAKIATESHRFNGLNFLEILDKKNNVIRKRSNPKIYQPCDLALELNQKHKISKDDIPIWVCIAKHESDYNTSAIGYGDHGLFQISEIYWCSTNDGAEKSCKISCNNLENDDITDDVECIKKIYKEHQRLTGDGFKAWTVYPLYCDNGRALKYTEKCDDTKYISTKETSDNNIFDDNVFLKPIFEISSTTELIPATKTIPTTKSSTKKLNRITTLKYQTSKSTTTTQRPQTLKPTVTKYQTLIKPEYTKITTKTTPKTSLKLIPSTTKVPRTSTTAIPKLTTKSTTPTFRTTKQSVTTKKYSTTKNSNKKPSSFSSISNKSSIDSKQTKNFIYTTTKKTTKTTPATSTKRTTISYYSKKDELKLQKISTKSFENDGQYDTHKYNSGQYDSGKYSQSKYESGIYDSGKYENKITTKSARTDDRAVSSKNEKISKRNIFDLYLNLYHATPKPN